MSAVSGDSSLSRFFPVSAAGQWSGVGPVPSLVPVLAAEAEAAGRVVRVAADVANRGLDVWVEVFRCGEILTAATLQAMRDSFRALQAGITGAPAGSEAVSPGLYPVELCWTVAEASALPYRDALGRISVRLAPSD
ncbi:hypothetical protein [Novispirillum itersonii]|uniref:Uncharacterized protein n=1 Tax=Novispirillum itersonii TaxID=189 RepID=A0A7W9ZIR6_NOVIT|nr:hypothetical protein [Novispirillum itersonii]MBB6212215.1 hypothetical protein [Novispirillum itersonii]